MYDGGYINKAVKTMTFPGNFFFLEKHKTMQSFQYYFWGKTAILYGKKIPHVQG